MQRRNKTCLAQLLVATALVTPATAFAQSTAREAQLEARLDRLEAEMQQLRGELVNARTEQAQTAAALQAATAKSDEAATKIATLEKKSPPADGFRVGNTTVKLGGFIKLSATSSRFSDGEVPTNSLGRDFYLPQSIPVSGGKASRVQDFSAKQSRFWLNLGTDVAGQNVKGYLEVDFQTSPGTQGSQRTTNGYNLALRRAYLQVGHFTFGQDWTTFQYTGALPETTDFLGATEDTVFVRQPLIRYSMPVSNGLTLHAAVENPESGTSTLGSPVLIENGDDRMPDVTARLAYTGNIGELSLAGLAREVRVENAGISAKNFGWGISGGGKIYLNDEKTSDLRFMATYGSNIGRYVGLNFAPDSVYDPVSGKLADVRNFAALAAARIAIAKGLRVNLIGSYQSVNYAGSLPAVSLAGYNRKAWSGAANLFWTPVPSIDLGIEYRHAEREVVDGAKGQLDRVEFAAKYSF
ncbi:hypothetical protein NT2_06_02360 [Caenibius tardaugens NBRC 16725]|uniref:Uncharacterized protein n=1 Tax=Caenibius tardaugens NBRC 16725 TaxID=1219035 RepID=U2Y940_9SPHN|nr:DcaP family trimeric outer membrane transporter [Caenibius tardaugens]GAD49796.1 hypothetical protein NT2_06_02360 [Caenibius tardaugens NBRC 16725]